jgi:hypothetical protein
MDEDNVNENLVEQLGYQFDSFLDEGNIEGCRKVIAEIKELDVLSAQLLEAELLNLPISHFRYGNI